MNDQLALFASEPPKQTQRSYHIRSHQPAQEALEGEAKARHQEAAVLQFYRLQDAAVPGVRFTPSEVWRAFEQRWPLTSIRRAMTNLASQGKLLHYPGHRRPGMFGAKESVWGLA